MGFYDKEGFGVLNLLGFYGKTKFETTWNIVKNGTAEPKMKHIKNISRGHLTEDDVAVQLKCITKCKTKIFILRMTWDMVQAQMHLDYWSEN